jgi:predicted lipid-binding transport protein (Tim44 family)
VRISWALLGGAIGVWLGYGGYPRLTHNADSFASFFALGFLGFFAWAGLFAGMACGVLIGGLSEWTLRRLGAGVAVAFGVATLVNAVALCQIVGVVEAKFPGLRAAPAQRPAAAPAKPRFRGVCSEPPPADAKARALWDSECH